MADYSYSSSSSSSSTSFPFLLLLCSLLLPRTNGQFGGGGGQKKETFSPTKAEVPLVSCEVCERVVLEAFNVGDKLRGEASPGTRVGEDDVIEGLQGLCMPKQSEGAWLSHLDLMESKSVDWASLGSSGSGDDGGDPAAAPGGVILGAGKKKFMAAAKKGNYLLVRDWGRRGHCKEECATLSASCQDLLDEGIDMDDLGVAVWKGDADTLKKRRAVGKEACAEACAGQRKSLPPKGRAKDHTWLMMSDQEVQMEELMAQMEASGLGGSMMNTDDMLANMGDEGMGGDGYGGMGGDPYGADPYGGGFGVDEMGEL
jgi:hypothetical protein